MQGTATFRHFGVLGLDMAGLTMGQLCGLYLCRPPLPALYIFQFRETLTALTATTTNAFV